MVYSLVPIHKKKHDTLHSVCISSGNKEGATKTSFSCTDLFFHYINHPVYSAIFSPFFIISIPSWTIIVEPCVIA